MSNQPFVPMLMKLSKVKYTIAVRNFFTSAKLLQQQPPVFDPSYLNPLTQNSFNNDKNKFQKSNYGNKQGSLSNLKLNFDSKVTDASDRTFDPNLMLSPKEDSLGSKLTGITAGRSVSVFNGNTMLAFQRLNSIIRSNQISRDKRNQRFYLKPGKAKEMRRSQKHRREFMKGFKRLIDVVKDAKRKGY